MFAAANVSFVEELERQGLILPDTKQMYARGRITLWTRADSSLQITSLADLTRPEVQRLAIANPDHAPYGVAARQAMQTAGIWEAVQNKLVLGENVRQTLQYAETGNVDVAIVALSLSVPAPAGDVGSLDGDPPGVASADRSGVGGDQRHQARSRRARLRCVCQRPPRTADHAQVRPSPAG